MKVSIMQPNLFMWCGLLKQFCDSDLHIVLDSCRSSRNERYNRNMIEGEYSQQWLTVPFRNFSCSREIRELECNLSVDVRKSLTDKFIQRYCNAPHFEEACAILDNTISQDKSESAYLVDIYELFLENLRAYGLPVCQSIRSSEIMSTMNTDEPVPSGVNLINFLLDSVGAEVYLASENTVQYAAREEYSVNKTLVQRFRYSAYDQVGSDRGCKGFTANLSCLDAIAHIDPGSMEEFLETSNMWI